MTDLTMVTGKTKPIPSLFLMLFFSLLSFSSTAMNDTTYINNHEYVRQFNFSQSFTMTSFSNWLELWRVIKKSLDQNLPSMIEVGDEKLYLIGYKTDSNLIATRKFTENSNIARVGYLTVQYIYDKHSKDNSVQLLIAADDTFEEIDNSTACCCNIL